MGPLRGLSLLPRRAVCHGAYGGPIQRRTISTFRPGALMGRPVPRQPAVVLMMPHLTRVRCQFVPATRARAFFPTFLPGLLPSRPPGCFTICQEDRRTRQTAKQTPARKTPREEHPSKYHFSRRTISISCLSGATMGSMSSVTGVPRTPLSSRVRPMVGKSYTRSFCTLLDALPDGVFGERRSIKTSV